MTERDLQKIIVFNLNRLEGCLCFSIYNSGIFNPRIGRYIKKSADMPKGVPDILGIYKGVAFAIEVKLPKGKVEPHQAIMHMKMEHFKWRVHVCRSVKESLDFVNGLSA